MTDRDSNSIIKSVPIISKPNKNVQYIFFNNNILPTSGEEGIRLAIDGDQALSARARSPGSLSQLAAPFLFLGIGMTLPKNGETGEGVSDVFRLGVNDNDCR